METRAAQTNVPEREPPQTSIARDDVIAALARVEQGQRDAMEDLRHSLCVYVGKLRQSGLSREATLSGVRALIGAPATPEGELSLTPVVRQALAELTLQWCEAEYNRLALETAGS
jgi:hypothetical protein